MDAARITVDEFRSEVYSHRQRVYRDAIRILSEFKIEFAQLSKLSEKLKGEIAHSFLILHDVPKIMTHEQLQEWSYQGDRSIFELLHSIYGIQVETRPRFLDELNAIELEMKTSMINSKFAFVHSEIRTQVIAEIQYAEWIADIVDTMSARGKELGVLFFPTAAENYFTNKQDHRAAQIASWLRKNRP